VPRQKAKPAGTLRQHVLRSAAFASLSSPLANRDWSSETQAAVNLMVRSLDTLSNKPSWSGCSRDASSKVVIEVVNRGATSSLEAAALRHVWGICGWSI
jgi:hypothetical protein